MRHQPIPETVTVVHAVPMLHVPPGSRTRALSLVRMETRADVRRCREADMEPVWVPNQGHSFCVGREDGDLWTRVRVGIGKRVAKPLAPAEFVDFLQGIHDPGGEAEAAILRYFLRTPLAPRDWHGRRSPALDAKRARGEAMPARGPGTVHHDGRDTGAADLAAFLARDVRVGEDSVYLRTPPLLRANFSDPTRFRVLPDRCLDPMASDRGPLLDADRQATYARCYPRYKPCEDGPELDPLRRAGVLDRGAAFEPLALANAMPAFLLGSIAAWDRPGRDVGIGEAERAAVARDAILGMTGSVRPEDAAAVVERAAAGLRTLSAYVGGFMEPGELREAASLLGPDTLARVAASCPTPGDDAEALGNLVP